MIITAILFIAIGIVIGLIAKSEPVTYSNNASIDEMMFKVELCAEQKRIESRLNEELHKAEEDADEQYYQDQIKAWELECAA